MEKPTISVVMPAFNAENYVHEAIESVLNQDFKDFEFIIINDGSTDNTENIIKSFDDERIILISRENKGIVESLNEGIALAKGEYVARMDADDICFPHRFSTQLSYMKENQLDLCGSDIILTEDNYIRRYPVQDGDIKLMLCFDCFFAHPTVMAKSEVLKKTPYPKVACEDYALWCQLALQNVKMGNIPEVLLRYRIHDCNLSQNKALQIQKDRDKINQDYARKMFPDFPFLTRANSILNSKWGGVKLIWKITQVCKHLNISPISRIKFFLKHDLIKIRNNSKWGGEINIDFDKNQK